MERFHRRLLVGTSLMVVGFLTVLLMLTGLVSDLRTPSWAWGLFMLVGVGAAVVLSAFVGAGRDRRRRTERLTGPAARR